MQSGVLSADNLPDLLRGISQRRRQGVLEIHGSDGVTSIKFVQGRIVEVAASPLTPVQEVVQCLARAGYGVGEPKSYSETSYSALLARLIDAGQSGKKVDKETLLGVIKHRVLERLYALDVGAGSMYSFKVQMVETERDFSPSISVGQLLLDLVELSAEREDFISLFPVGAIARKSPPASPDTDDEQKVLDAVGGGASLEDITSKSLLSSYHLRHALLGLHKRGGILVDTGIPATEQVAPLQTMPSSTEFVSSGDERTTIESLVAESVDESIRESAGETSRPRASIHIVSARLLQNSSVPSVVGLLVLLGGLLAPFVLWADVFSHFAE